jgi:hypothetical protein
VTTLPSITGTRTRMGTTNPVSLSNDRVTTCKVCGFGVFKHQSHRWSTSPTGISHNECLDSLEPSDV